MTDEQLDAKIATLERIHEHEIGARAGEYLAVLRELSALRHTLAAASAALDELVAPDPDKPLPQRIRDEFHDFKMVLDHLTTVYDHFSNGRITKPNTLPAEVIAVASDLATKEQREAIEEETRALRAELDELLHQKQQSETPMFSRRELLAERDSLRAQIHDLCHDKHTTGPVTPGEFCDGCEQFQIRLFGSSPITALRERLTVLVGERDEALASAAAWKYLAALKDASATTLRNENNALRFQLARVQHLTTPATP